MNKEAKLTKSQYKFAEYIAALFKENRITSPSDGLEISKQAMLDLVVIADHIANKKHV